MFLHLLCALNGGVYPKLSSSRDKDHKRCHLRWWTEVGSVLGYCIFYVQELDYIDTLISDG